MLGGLALQQMLNPHSMTKEEAETFRESESLTVKQAYEGKKVPNPETWITNHLGHWLMGIGIVLIPVFSEMGILLD